MAGLAALALLAAAVGCTSDKGTESPPSFNDKADGINALIDHGVIAPEQEDLATLDGQHRFHAWSFDLSDRAVVSLATGAADDGSETDTVLYLFDQRLDGNFDYQAPLGRNDDANPETSLSRLTMVLDAGSYRAVVKGFALDESGEFAVIRDCVGLGCATP